jgi:tRNA(Ile2) C34 agmatinyltransferase TiaS
MDGQADQVQYHEPKRSKALGFLARMMVDTPFCKVCGYLMERNGSGGWRCRHCGYTTPMVF